MCLDIVMNFKDWGFYNSSVILLIYERDNNHLVMFLSGQQNKVEFQIFTSGTFLLLKLFLSECFDSCEKNWWKIPINY
jgi:hypothetical protein